MPQEPDPAPGDYYVTCIDGPRTSLLLGPFTNDHAGALAMVDKARERAIELNSWAHFYSFGTCRMKPEHQTNPPYQGILNDHFGLNPTKEVA
jgi:hypothetical protein